MHKLVLQKKLREFLTLISKSQISFNARLITLMSVVVIASSGCKKEEPPRSYKVIDTGMWTSVPGGPIKWLDNDRVLFPSNEKLAPAGGPARMTVWRPATGQLEFFQPWRSDVCVEDSQVVYGVNDATGKNVTYYRGPVENPQEYPPPRHNMYMRKNFSCGWAEKDIRESRASIPYRIRLRDDNFLEITGENPNPEPDPQNLRKSSPVAHTAAYHEREGSNAVPLPLMLSGWDSYYPNYIEWRNAYLIAPDAYYPGRRIRLWWIERDGRILEEQLPESLSFPAPGGIAFYPTPNGIFIHYNGGDLKKVRGGYFLKNDKLEQLIKANLHGVALSPDGCRVVFDHAQNPNDYLSKEKPHRTLKMIDFCIQGGKQ